MSTIDFENAGFGTLAIHGGQEPDKLHGALATPIYQTSTFCFGSVEEGTAKFGGEIPGFCYTRGGNPTTVTLEKKIAMLEGGEACITTASGMGAVGGVMLGLLGAGDHVICGECVYGCTDVVLRTTLQKFGVEVSYVDTTDLEALKAAIKENTKLIYFESLTNPTMELTDIAAVSGIAHERGVLVAVDNTFTPPPQIYPLKEGADIVLHSCTKYINGHGDVISGAIIGSEELITPIRRGVTSKICGTTPSPFNSFLILRGLQTMELRMERHGNNGLAVARYLESVPYVKKVYYPGLDSYPQHELAKKLMHDNYGGIMSFELKDEINGIDGFEACKKVVNALKIASIAVSLGDPGTLIQHPASMTHANMSKEARAEAGIKDDLIRLSVGLENAKDIIADFEQAFKAL